VIVFLKNFVSVYTKRWLSSWAWCTSGVILFAPRACLGGAQVTHRLDSKEGHS